MANEAGAAPPPTAAPEPVSATPAAPGAGAASCAAAGGEADGLGAMAAASVVAAADGVEDAPTTAAMDSNANAAPSTTSKDKDYKYRKLLYLFKFSKSTKKSKKEAKHHQRNTLGTPEERRSQLDRDMKNSWDTLPETLRKKKQRVSRALLSEFIDADSPDGPEDKSVPAGTDGGVSPGAGKEGSTDGAAPPRDALQGSGVYYDDEDVDDEDEDTKSSSSSSSSDKNEVCVYQVQPGRPASAGNSVEVRAMFHRQDEDTSLVGQNETQIGEEEIYQKIHFDADKLDKRVEESVASRLNSDNCDAPEAEPVAEENAPPSKTEDMQGTAEGPKAGPGDKAMESGTQSPPSPLPAESLATLVTPTPPAASLSTPPPTPSPDQPSPASTPTQPPAGPSEAPAAPSPTHPPSPSGVDPPAAPSPVDTPSSPSPTQPPPRPQTPALGAPKDQHSDADSSGEGKAASCSSSLGDANNNWPSDSGGDTEYATVGLSGRSCEESDATTVAADDTVSLYSRPQPRPVKQQAPATTTASSSESTEPQPLGLDSEALAAVELLARAVSSDSLLGGSNASSQCSPANSHSSLDNMKLHEDDSGTDVNNPSSSSSSSAASSCAGDAVAAVVECGEYEDVSPVVMESKTESKADPKPEPQHVYEAMLPKDNKATALYSAVGKTSKLPAPGAQPLPGMYSDVKEAGAVGTPQYLLEALSKRAAAQQAKQDDEHYTFMELAPGDKSGRTTSASKAPGATTGLYVKKSQQTTGQARSGSALLSKSASGCVAALSQLSAQKFPPHLSTPIFYNPLVQCPPPDPEPAPAVSPCRDDPLLRPGNKKPCPVFKPHGFEPLSAPGGTSASDSEHLTDSFDEDESVMPSGRPGLVEEPLWRRPPDANSPGALCSWRGAADPLLCRRSVTMETIVEEPTSAAAAAGATVGSTGSGPDDSRLTVREILRRFEELGGKVPSLCDAERRDAEDGQDDEEDAEKSATLREIQETLMNLEEKVRNYQCRMASSSSTSSSGPPSLQLQPPQSPQPQLPPQQLQQQLQQQQQQQQPPQQTHSKHHHHHHHHRQQRGGRLESFQSDHRKQSMDGWTGRVPQPPQPQQPQPQQALPHQQQHLQQRHAAHGPSSMPPMANGHHTNGHGPSSLPSPLSEHGVAPGQAPGQGQVHDGKHSLLQFAIHHFRQSPEKFEMLKTADGSISGSLDVIESLKTKKSKGKSKGNKENEWTWKEQVDLVKFSPRPIEQSLLRLEPDEVSELAVECFVCVMRYMGDLPMTTDVTEVKCVYTVLMHCHKHESLRDEVYCQLMKQTTNNKSQQPESCQRGWRLFSIVAAYFACSDTLKPYLFKYLETAAYDKRRAYHGTAMVCLQNLRKTFKYGGRKNVPSVEEITAISAGRNSKRQMYRLPGGTERVVNTRSTTVVQDVIEEICGVINVTSPQEMEEFSLYCIVEGDTFTMPLAREEYILDVTTELHKNGQIFYLIFCRSVWHFPLRLDSHLYIEVVFNQIAPDYLEGLLLVMPGETLQQDTIYEIAKMAALLHRAADMTHVPAMKETKFLLPKPALTVRDIKPAQWVNMVQSSWVDVQGIETIQAKAQVLEMLSRWPLFGSSFFAVKRVSDPKERADHILALNRHGVHFVDIVTHETLLHHPFSEVISTRKVKSEDGTLFLDMKCGNLMQQRITRLQTDQAHEISRLIRQYITLQQRVRT